MSCMSDLTPVTDVTGTGRSGRRLHPQGGRKGAP